MASEHFESIWTPIIVYGICLITYVICGVQFAKGKGIGFWQVPVIHNLVAGLSIMFAMAIAAYCLLCLRPYASSIEQFYFLYGVLLIVLVVGFTGTEWFLWRVSRELTLDVVRQHFTMRIAAVAVRTTAIAVLALMFACVYALAERMAEVI